MQFDDIYGSIWLKAEDLKGKAVRAKIENIETATFTNDDGREKRQAVLCFRNTKKKLGLNVTNARTIKTMFGDNLIDWIGQVVTLYPTTTTNSKGQIVPCIRIMEQGQSQQIAQVPIQQPQPQNGGQLQPVNKDSGRYQTLERQPIARMQQAPNDTFGNVVDDIVNSF